MAFIIENNEVISFAEYSDVTSKDKILFDNNEGLDDEYVEDALIRATERILLSIKSTEWWQSLYVKHNGSVNALDIPTPQGSKIKARTNDFTDLCVYRALADYILPSVADFGDENNAERQKMGFYGNRATELFMELVNSGDWYDFDGDDIVQTDEKRRGNVTLKRIR
jgi:hypothetical protein